MKINKVIVENFGIYDGVNEFNFNVSKDKNIILIGGKNGNGKTTLFTSIKLCLYGSNFSEKRLIKSVYEKYLISKIHNNPNKKKKYNSSSITVNLEQVFNGEITNYEIKRSWNNTNNVFSENFEVLKNGKKLNDLDIENWQDFIEDLIPKGLSQLFFFDGEKIQNLIEDKNNNEEFVNSFKVLLGLEDVERLKADLEIYLNKEIKNIASESIKIDFENKENELNQIDKKIGYLMQEKSQLESDLDLKLREIEKFETKVKTEGGNFAENRDKIKSKIDQYETKIKVLEDEFREKCSKLLPFYFSKDLLNKLNKRLIKESENETNKILSKEVSKRLSKSLSELKDYIKKEKINDKVFNDLKSKLEENLSFKSENLKLVHTISDKDKIKIHSVLDYVDTSSFDELKEFNKEHRKLSKKLLVAQKEYNYVPLTEVIAPYLESINALNQNIGEIKNKLENKQEEINGLFYKEKIVKNELQKLKGYIKENNHYKNTIQEIENIQNVLTEYYSILEDEKLSEFKDSFIKNFETITRKKNAYVGIEIDKNTYNISLIKADGSLIPKERLSEGEKQLYALTVLWTLTKLSKRNFPFIIDTPLGRLDHSHRGKLIKTFFPKISEQLIILSTDSEIDSNYHDNLKENISKEYLLVEDNGSTKVKGGYFY